MIQRKKLIYGNWKMNCLLKDARDFIAHAKQNGELIANKGVETAIFPPFTLLSTLHEGLKGLDTIQIGAQDLYFEGNGAFTGEISPVQLKDVGCSVVLVGHSERRHILGEDEHLLRRKVAAAVETGLKTVYCIGEKLEQREKGEHFSTVETQLRNLSETAGLNDSNLVIAYEPVWAIGTGKNATGDQAEEMHRFIREKAPGLIRGITRNISILYGGSVKSGNIEELLSQKDVDGGLIGGASIDWPQFFDIILKAAKL